jgi:hypothetical protein
MMATISVKAFFIVLPGRAMAQAVSHRRLTAAAWVRAQVSLLEFVMKKWHWDRFFSEFLGFALSISFQRGLHFSENKKKTYSSIHSFIHPSTHSHPGTDKRPVKAAAVQ